MGVCGVCGGWVGGGRWVSIIIEAGIKQRMDLHTVVPSWYAN